MKLRGAWRRDYSEFFDTQEALLIDAMDNADSIYTVFARLQSLLVVKCGARGKLFSTKALPNTGTRCLSRSPRRPFPPSAMRARLASNFGLVICEDGICAIADWGVQPERPGNRRDARGKPEPKAKERARKSGGKSASGEEA